jgi:hypothetical protein
MPQNCQIIGVNSVTNIELGKGVMPAPIIRNADWFEIFASVRIPVRFLLHINGCPKASERAFYADSKSLFLTSTG